jgi:hypothetical protein
MLVALADRGAMALSEPMVALGARVQRAQKDEKAASNKSLTKVAANRQVPTNCLLDNELLLVRVRYCPAAPQRHVHMLVVWLVQKHLVSVAQLP